MYALSLIHSFSKGRRWIYIISLLMAALGNVGTALSTNISVLFISRIITAAGGSSVSLLISTIKEKILTLPLVLLSFCQPAWVPWQTSSRLQREAAQLHCTQLSLFLCPPLGKKTKKCHCRFFLEFYLYLLFPPLPVRPVAGGAIVEHFGWRGLFWALAIVAFAIWLMLLLFLPETSPRTNVAPVSFRDKMLTNPFASLKLLGYPNVLMVSIYSGVL